MTYRTKPLISLITATYNSGQHVSRLINSVNIQDYKNFEWIICDNCSNDNTVDLINSHSTAPTTIICEQDDGIYDALNKAIAVSRGDYYIVAGSDDILHPNALFNFSLSAANNKKSVHTANIKMDDKLIKLDTGVRFYKRQFLYVTSHSVATMFKKNLHDELGLYDTSFKIAADQDFIMKVAEQDSTAFHHSDFIAGEFTLNGISSTNEYLTAKEGWKVQLKYDNVLLVSGVFFIRLIKIVWRKFLGKFS